MEGKPLVIKTVGDAKKVLESIKKHVPKDCEPRHIVMDKEEFEDLKDVLPGSKDILEK